MGAHFCYKIVHCGIFVYCIVRFVRLRHCIINTRIYGAAFGTPMLKRSPLLLTRCGDVMLYFTHGVLWIYNIERPEILPYNMTPSYVAYLLVKNIHVIYHCIQSYREMPSLFISGRSYNFRVDYSYFINFEGYNGSTHIHPTIKNVTDCQACSRVSEASRWTAVVRIGPLLLIWLIIRSREK